MDPLDLLRKFHSTLPAVKDWIQTTLKEYKNQAVSVSDLDFSRLKKVYPPELLSRAKVIIVAGDIPFPPMSRMGMTEFAQMENMPIAGITYTDTFFVNQFYQTDKSLYFHELVHIVQWDRLGADNFLLAYAMGLMQFGYDDSPLEKMAYSLQMRFDTATLPKNTVEIIQEKTDRVWNEAEAEIKRLSNNGGIDF